MSKTPFLQLYVADYMADTRHLTTEQHGAYLLLLMTMWRHNGKLPNDPKKLSRICGVTPRKWPAIWEDLAEFFVVENDEISNPRLTKEYQKAEAKSKLRANAGSLGGKAKALKNNNTDVAKATVLPKQGQIPEYRKKEKEKKKEREILCQVLSEKAADDYIAHRISKRSKLTERAAELIVKKLDGHSDPDGVVENSIANGWTGVFPDKTASTNEVDEQTLRWRKMAAGKH